MAFGRDYIATPDRAERIALSAELSTPDPETFYPSVDDPERDPTIGYTDYPSMVRVSPHPPALPAGADGFLYSISRRRALIIGK